MRRYISISLFALILALGFTFNAGADPIVYSDSTNPAVLPYTGTYSIVDFGNETSQTDIDIEIASWIGTDDELYKKEVDGGFEFGSFAGSYETEFFNEPLDPAEATISYVGPLSITDPSYLLVKDGASVPAWYLFDISAWNGTDYLFLENFWPQSGAISHVSIYGGETVIPEPTSLLLLGTGLAGLGLIVRRKKSRR